MAQTEPRILKATMKFDGNGPIPVVDGDSGPSECPQCGYPLSGSPSVCPNCGNPLRADAAKPADQAPVAAQASAQTQSEFSKKTVRIGAVASPAAAATPASAAQDRKFGKQTIREIPKDLRQADSAQAAASAQPAPARPAPARNVRQVFRLVPLHGTDHPEIKMEEGDVITINNLRFRFTK